jgi:uncharacterized RDD family membrane protein YckC
LPPEPSRLNDPAEQTPLRQIPGLPRKERTWKDEVRDRVAARRRRRASGLQRTLGDLELEPPPLGPAAVAEQPIVREPEPEPEQPRMMVEQPPSQHEPELEYSLGDDTVPFEAEPPLETPSKRPRVEPAVVRDPLDELLPEPTRAEAPEPAERPSADDLFDAEEDDSDWEVELGAPARAASQVERPASVSERVAAASLDGALLSVLAGVVLYFASRAAQAPVSSLSPSWPWLTGYLAFLGLVYAACFTGITGQTPGKMWTGLRVVSRSGTAPGIGMALLRAATASAGILLACIGLVPMFLDPARRGLHDRIFGTRVIRR